MKRRQKTSAEHGMQKLRLIEIQTAQGKGLVLVRKEAELSEQSYKDECLKHEILNLLKEAQTVISIWQNTFNRVRPHSTLDYRPPAPITFPDLAFRLPMPPTLQ